MMSLLDYCGARSSVPDAVNMRSEDEEMGHLLQQCPDHWHRLKVLEAARLAGELSSPSARGGTPLKVRELRRAGNTEGRDFNEGRSCDPRLLKQS